MADGVKKSDGKFLFGWIYVNFFTWLVGLFFILPFSIFVDASPIVLSDELYTLFMCLLFGALVGFKQWLMLSKWGVRPILWILATSLGFGIPMTLLYWYDNSLPWYAPIRHTVVPLILGPLLISICVGLAQKWVIRVAISKPTLWVRANVIGIFISQVLYIIGLIFLFFLINPVSSDAGELLYGLVSTIMIPFYGTVSALFTGLVLLKHGKNVDGEGAELPETS
ncbi:MAG: hypothetical protein JXB38_00680 [Anaerolineales bacterium]|nr:hypothetical protein [Anaerolineales bacterium]